MKTKITLIVLALCLYSAGYAQVEQTAREMAESEHQRFANELPDALSKGKTGIFGLALEKKQFFLEEDANTFSEFLGWDKKKYNHSTLNNVFTALSEKIKSGKKNPNPVTVSINFPNTPSECNVSIKTDSKGTLANYTVTTKANVTVEAGKQGVKSSVAKNVVALTWEGKLPLVNGEVNNSKKIAAPVLRSIKITPVTDFSESSEPLKSGDLDKYTAPVPVAPEIVPVEEIVETKPALLPVEPKAEPIVEPKVEFVEPKVEPKVEPAVEQKVSQPVRPPVAKPVAQTEGLYYKVQIMANDFYKPVAELPQKFRVDGVVVEKYRSGYKYVVPAGTTMREALAKQRQLAEKGLDQTWIVVYQNGERFRPWEGKPESSIE